MPHLGKSNGCLLSTRDFSVPIVSCLIQEKALVQAQQCLLRSAFKSITNCDYIVKIRSCFNHYGESEWNILQRQ